MSGWRKLGVIAGGGELPVVLAEHLAGTQRPYFVARISPMADARLDAVTIERIELLEEFGLAFLFISHNIAVTALMSRRIGVMYLGQLVEIGPSRAIVEAPRHPYTQALIAAVPAPDPARRRRRGAVEGDVPSPIERPAGCPFHPRCPLAQAICAAEEPQLREIGREHQVACHFA